ncbi:MAG: hypothetical protein JSV06_11350 [Myxococcales bacterium]|nr:MAG: hypothetical protein JSV06_11350 [Myxococcales bacterium]
MRRRTGWLLVGVCLLASCTGKAEAVRAARPHIEAFDELRVRALDLLVLRADVERKKLLFAAANGDEESLPENLRPVFEQMQSERVELTKAQLQRGEALFWRMLDRAFSDNPDVLQAEIVFLEKDGSISRFAHPREQEVPAGVKWFGLRQQRTFAGVASCVTDEGSEPCVLIQLRPRDYSGSAGLTVGFRRAP